MLVDFSHPVKGVLQDFFLLFMVGGVEYREESLFPESHRIILAFERYRPAILDPHESGTIGWDLKRTSIAKGFGFLIFTLNIRKNFKVLNRFIQKSI